MKKFDLEDRLVKFSIQILNLGERITKSYAGDHLSKQLSRSGTSPSLNYAEAISAESRNDFVHKMKIALKELRETLVCLRIIKEKPLITDKEIINGALDECNQLISIFVTSIKTANKQLLQK